MNVKRSTAESERDWGEQSESKTLTLSKVSCPLRIPVLMREQNLAFKGQISNPLSLSLWRGCWVR